MKDGTRLKCDDFLQNYQVNITIVEMKSEEKERDNAEVFEIIGDRSKLVPKEEHNKSGMNGKESGPSSAMSKGKFSLYL